MSHFKRRFNRKNEDCDDRDSRKKRKDDSATPGGTESEEDSTDGSGIRVHVPKTKYAIAFGYVGSAYHGYQMQAGIGKDSVDTVEGRMLEALFKAGAIHEAHLNLLGKLQISKASRTDKGVHAACTYMGGRLQLSHLSQEEPSVPREEALTTKMNELLPEDIRCYRVLRVTRGFCARSMCSKRKYEYIIPVMLLKHRYIVDEGPRKNTFDELSRLMESHLSSSERISCIRQGTSEGYVGKTEERDVDLTLFQDILSEYCGSHEFRNFTPYQKGMENTTKRFIHEIKVEQRTIANSSEEIISIVITGQSFLYNQIRKMISLAYEVYLGTAPRVAIEFTLSRNHKMQTGIAPAEGLFLHHPFFEAYNKRCNPPQTPLIDYEDIEPLVEDFKATHIYPTVAKSFDGDVWTLWLSRIVRNPFFLENQDFQVSGEEHGKENGGDANVASNSNEKVEQT